jgi:hypothetical protein
MEVSAEFSKQLEREFDGRFRVRWSNRRDAYQVEFKVQMGQVLEPPMTINGSYDTYNDDYIRARDGYDFLVEVRRGDRMPCPNCGFTVALIPMQMREAQCEYCTLRGKDGRVSAVFYPLNHVLIEHLRFIDPITGGAKRVLERVKKNMALRQERADAMAFNEIDEVNKEFFPKFYDIKSYGYTGNGPASHGR